jgi:hypothetical protein
MVFSMTMLDYLSLAKRKKGRSVLEDFESLMELTEVTDLKQRESR